MKKRICPNCNEPNPASNYICSNCDTSLTKTPVFTVDIPQALKIRKCPKCGVEISGTSFSCSQCGEYLVSGTVSKSHQQSTSTVNSIASQSSNTFLFVVSFIIPLVGIIAGAIFLTSDDEYKKHDGKVCLLLGIASTILVGLISFLIINSAFKAIL